MTTPTDPQLLIAQAYEVCKAATPGPWEVHEVDCEQYDDDEETGSRGIRSTHPAKGGGLNHGEDVELFTRGDATFIATARTLVPALADALEDMTREWERTEQSATSYRQSLRNCRRELADHKANMPVFVADAYAKGRAFNEDVDDRVSEDE